MVSKSKLFALALSLSPILALAQTAPTFGGSTYFTTMSSTFATVIDNLLPAFMGLGFIAFFYFLFKFITSQGEDKAKEKKNLLWAVVAIIIMISIYGLAGLVQDIFGAGAGTSTISAPIIE
ncbi:MAG: hypothetical protein WCV68_03340 [Candidatus Paceibacterota bacterium]|jgi:hypothetical protein